jgi:hypothetical protein
LENILRELKLLEEQAKVEGFFNNVENADTLGGLAEGIRDAVMEYQVRNRNELITPMPDIRSDIITARYLSQKLPTHCKPHFLAVRPCVVTCE